jgi:ABC-type glycerol-3-phosphate transport system permease component
MTTVAQKAQAGRRRRRPRKPGEARSAWRAYVPMTLLAIFFLFPMLFMVMSSFKPTTRSSPTSRA